MVQAKGFLLRGEQGHEVLCADNFYTGRRANIAHLVSNPLFEALRHDICLSLYVETDDIYNLVCPAYPVQTTKTGVHGAINMLGLAKRVKTEVHKTAGFPLLRPC
jgi:UDP-glucuronate decarboxylase